MNEQRLQSVKSSRKIIEQVQIEKQLTISHQKTVTRQIKEIDDRLKLNHQIKSQFQMKWLKWSVFYQTLEKIKIIIKKKKDEKDCIIRMAIRMKMCANRLKRRIRERGDIVLNRAKFEIFGGCFLMCGIQGIQSMQKAQKIVSHVLESYTHAKHCMVSVLDFSEKVGIIQRKIKSYLNMQNTFEKDTFQTWKQYLQQKDEFIPEEQFVDAIDTKIAQIIIKKFMYDRRRNLTIDIQLENERKNQSLVKKKKPVFKYKPQFQNKFKVNQTQQKKINIALNPRQSILFLLRGNMDSSKKHFQSVFTPVTIEEIKKLIQSYILFKKLHQEQEQKN